MTDQQYRDFCAATAASGLIARYDGEEENLRHHYHVLAVEAFRMADEMVACRQRLNQSHAAD